MFEKSWGLVFTLDVKGVSFQLGWDYVLLFLAAGTISYIVTK